MAIEKRYFSTKTQRPVAVHPSMEQDPNFENWLAQHNYVPYRKPQSPVATNIQPKTDEVKRKAGRPPAQKPDVQFTEMESDK